MQHEMDAFLLELFQGTAPNWFYLWTLHDKQSHWFTEHNLDDYFAAVTTGEIGDRDVYVGVALAAEEGSPEKRVKASAVAGLVGLWADVDYQDPLHQKQNLPRDLEHALAIIDDFPLQPTLTISSGHGLQCWWLFEEPWLFESDAEREAGATLARRWHGALRNVLSRHGCALDSTFDLARVLRVPGTINAKDPQNLQPVVLREKRKERFNPSDFDAYLVDDIVGDKVDIKVADIDPLMQPPQEFVDKFLALMENDPNFANIFFHRKKLQGAAADQSMSAYDLALANIAVRVGWTDEEVLMLLIKHRHRHGEVTKHKGYYENTISKARSAYRFESQAAQIGAGGAAEATQVETPQIDRDETLRAISERLGVTVNNIVIYTGNPPKYRLYLTDRFGTAREANLGGADVWVNQATFRKKVIEVARISTNQLKNDVWNLTTNLLLHIAEEQSLGEDMTEEGQLRAWIDAFLRTRRPETSSVEIAVMSKTSFYHDGAIHIYPRTFRQYLHDQLGERFDAAEVAAMLVRLGATERQIKYRPSGKAGRTTTEARRLPVELFPPGNYINLDEVAYVGGMEDVVLSVAAGDD